jgi:hypothetical protein
LANLLCLGCCLTGAALNHLVRASGGRAELGTDMNERVLPPKSLPLNPCNHPLKREKLRGFYSASPRGESGRAFGAACSVISPCAYTSFLIDGSCEPSPESFPRNGTTEVQRNTHHPCAFLKNLDFIVSKWCARGGFELPTFWFVAARSTLPNLARGVANRANSASWGKFPQITFSSICRRLPHFCCRFPQLALHFRDRRKPLDRILAHHSPILAKAATTIPGGQCPIFSMASNPYYNWSPR